MDKKKIQIMAISAVTCCCAVAADVTITVNAGDPDKTLEASDIAGLGASDNLVKAGDGRLIIDSAVFGASWSGAVGVSNGYLRIAHVDGLGPAGAKGAVVADGATIEFDGTALNNADLTCAKVAFEGEGADGESAIRVVGANWGHKNMAWTLTGPATWGGTQSKGEHFNGGTQSIDMGGHTLTVRGNGVKNNIYFFMQVADLISNPGDVVVDNGVYFITEATKLLGGDTHTLRFKASCSWRMANNNKNDMTWRMVLDPGVWVSWAASSWTAKWPDTNKGWSGPIEIGYGAGLQWSPGVDGITCTITGAITGEGTVQLSNNYLILDNPGNSIAYIDNYNGTLYATSLSAVLPSFTNGHFTCSYNNYPTHIAIAEFEKGAPSDAAILYFLAHYPSVYEKLTRVPWITLGNTNDFAVSSPVEMENSRYYVGRPYPEVATLTVGDGAALNAETHSNGVGIVLGLTATNFTVNSRGILRLNAGGAITNRVSSIDNIQLPNPPRYSQGSFIIDGGDYYNNDTSWQYGMVGHQIGGYVQMRGGKWRSNGWTCFGHGSYGYGAFEMLGGTFSLPSGAVGVGSHGGAAHLYIGGTATVDVARMDTGFMVWGDAASTQGAYGVLTIDGEASVKVSAANFGTSSNSVTMVNLNGGKFVTAPALLNGSAFTHSRQINNQERQAQFDIADNLVYLNFNGGTLQLSSHGGSSLYGYRLTQMTVYKGGANYQLNTPSGVAGGGTFHTCFKAPTGKGVGSIPIPEVEAWEFSGAPLIKIEGDGWGASAFAQFDAERGLITNIVVTSPGCDYTWAKATLYRGGPTNDTEIVITDYLVDNDKSGGVRFFGDGELTISGPNYQCNTYEGPTTISTGAIVQYWTASWYYPTNSPLVMDGGTCRFGSGGFTTLGSPALTGLSGFGTVHAAGITARRLGFDAASFTAGKALDLQLSGKLTLPAGTTVKIENAERLAAHRTERFTLLTTTGTIDSRGALAIDSDGALDAGWKLFVSENRIRIGCSRIGTRFTIR